MIRKILVVAAAVAMPISAVAVTGGFAGAAGARTAATDTIVCKTITGTVGFSPKLTSAGHAKGKESISVTGTLGGCTVSGSTKITVTKGAISGTLVNPSTTGTCSSIVGNSADAGPLTVKWTASSTTPNTVLNVKSVTGATVSGHGSFTIPGTTKGTASGSFGGTNAGASQKSVAETSLTASSNLTTCTHSGLSSFAIQAESGKSAVSLG